MAKQPILVEELLQTETGEEFYPITIDAQIRLFDDPEKNLKDKLENIKSSLDEKATIDYVDNTFVSKENTETVIKEIIDKNLQNWIEEEFTTEEELKEELEPIKNDLNLSFDYLLKLSPLLIYDFTHIYDSSNKIHYLQKPLEVEDFITYKNIRFIATEKWNPGDRLYINNNDGNESIPVCCYDNLRERIEEEELFEKNTVVNITLLENSIGGYDCFFKLGGTNDLKCKIIGESTYPKSLSNNLLYLNAPENEDDLTSNPIYSNGDGSVTISSTSLVGSLSIPIYMETGKNYTICGNSRVGVNIEYYNENNEPTFLFIDENDNTRADVTSAITFFWDDKKPKNANYIIRIQNEYTPLSLEEEDIIFWPQLNEGSELLPFEQYKQKENLIWIKTSEDMVHLEEVAGSSTRGAYINTSGKIVTAASGDTCITKCFMSKERNIYNFKLNDYKTFIVAAFLEKPVVNSIGDILFNSSNDEILEEYVNIKAPVGYKYIAVYYYHIDKNENIPSLTITNLTSKTDIDKNSYIFKQNQPYYNFINDSNIIENSYIADDGRIKTQANALAPSYTKNYIPVKYGEKYFIEYTTSEKKQLWLSICEYNASKAIIGTRDERIAIAETETSESKLKDRFEDIYTPSSEKVAFVRLTWRTFSPSGVVSSVFFGYNDENNLITNKNNIVYFKTTCNIENSKEFNFSKKNSVIMNLEKTYTGNNEDWVEKDFYIYKNGKWI